ncbi:toprim domain-containing protein [Candidatus Nomurabacteria bacterium]|nr:toprim domain-containing protein [Candidatus Nomurabacteria bacterium]
MTTKINIQEYLSQKGITYRESGEELITKCIFNDCDRESRAEEAHLYFNKETGQYDCKKCGEKGNLITLQKHFGDKTTLQRSSSYRGPRFNDALVQKCHDELPERTRTYLNNRGIIDGVINSYKIGYGIFYGKKYITIPVMDDDGYKFFKLRQDPEDGDGKITYPKGAEAQLFGMYAPSEEKQIICEGELDALSLISQGCFALTSTHGAGTFKEEWIDEDIKKCQKIYVCFDNDEAGKKGSIKVLKMLENTGLRNLYHITLPEEVGDGGDITDYLTKLNLSVPDLFDKYAKEYPERIDPSQFQPLKPEDIVETLELTIKNDNENKVVSFLCQLSAYTEDAQFNISFNSPSSTGKSYIALEVSKLFPNEDVIKLGNCSKTAFFHEQGSYNKETNEITVDLSRKILIFTDMPHTGLLEGLRSFLSHDEKIMYSKITDKNQKGGNRTKTIALKGYPSVIFCTAGLRMDPQEQTRFILLSPEVNQEKIYAGISNTIRKEVDNEKYREWLDNDPKRKLLKLRIQAIRQERIDDIKISNQEKIFEQFFKEDRKLQPRHQRDIKRLLSLVKSFALLNLWWRERNGSTITANDEDIEQAFKLWEKISISQELNLPPFIYDIYMEIIIPAYKEKNEFQSQVFDETPKHGITRQEILEKHYKVYGRMLDAQQLRQQIIPVLETSGLIYQEQDPNDKRKILISPSTFFGAQQKNNSDDECGVDTLPDNESSELEQF